MSKGESPKSGWASFRPRRKQKLSRPSASRWPTPNSKVSCERLSRLISLSLDENVCLEVRRKVMNNCQKEIQHVDSEVSPKFRFACGVDAGSACSYRFQQGWEWGARVLWTAVQRDELFRGLRMQYFR